MNKKFQIIWPLLYAIGIVSLFFYSYTQVDLNLTYPFEQLFKIQAFNEFFGQNISLTY